MTKKMIFGLLLTLVGMAFSLFCFIQAAIHPWDYNGIDGLWGSFLGTGMLSVSYTHLPADKDMPAPR